MAEYHIKGIFKHRRDTSSNWTAKNPIILDGEIILVDTSVGDIRVKVGDGTKHYSELPFLDEKINVGTAYRALITDTSGRLSTSSVTSTELEYISGVTSAVQTQLNNKVPSSRTINKKALTSDITLSASDVGAQPKITVNGIIQGDSSGNLSAAETVEAETIELNAAAVGLGNVDNVRQYSKSNPPPYPVTSANGQTGAVKTNWYFDVTGSVASPSTTQTVAQIVAAQTAGFAPICKAVLADFKDLPATLPALLISDMLCVFGGIGSTGGDTFYLTVIIDGDGNLTVKTDAVAAKGDIPAELPNPWTLNIKIGDTTTSYDGSAEETVEIPKGVPSVTTADNGKILRVVNGVWATAELLSAGGASF